MESASKPEPRQSKPKSPKTSRASKISQAQIILALKKKKECNTRAQEIVEELLDPVAADKVPAFLAKLPYINQSHFDDIIEERAIMKLCGYPLCDIELVDVPSKQYQISATQNKVYDITQRKNFCSTKCYKSSEYLKEQLLTTPLWIRKDDDRIPEFKLLTFD